LSLGLGLAFDVFMGHARAVFATDFFADFPTASPGAHTGQSP
jgi:hypothetical protein